MIRIGQGYDVHRLVEDRELWLGGIRIPYEKGLLGHSDADVLIHALCDALLGAAALRDIGYHFPDTDPRYKGIDSKLLLAETVRLITECGFRINNVDVTVMAQQPKINPHIPDMCNVLSGIMGIPQDCVSIKATTTEKLGFVGRGEGMAALAVALIEK
ncbi:MAG: 2-C-methyl-D-erythritol 2,4-cyclodiphosphate synthase [Bacteroidaceae bacterium]|nr:2-C-methyl-D-erythritol 2,4-cyclodiphosphate synthase [Bacteroidaceae bacterium]